MELAASCRATLTDGAPWPSPLAFADQLRAANLDGSPESMARLDALLRTLRTTHQLSPAAMAAIPGGETFLILAAVALGLVVERATGVPIEWLDRTHAARRLPPDMALPEDGWARLFGVVTNSPMVPLGVIESGLFDADPGMSCESYAQRWVSRVQKTALLVLPDMDANERCRELLDALTSGTAPAGGLAYAKALRQANLDYSAQSLQRLDALLRQIREQVKPERSAFMMRPVYQNFLQLVAFYAASCTARVGQLPIKWLAFGEAASLQGDLQPDFETQFACLLDGKLQFPLRQVCALLFVPGANNSLQSWSSNVTLNATHRLISIKRPKPTRVQVPELIPEWATAVQQAGYFAAQSLFMVEGGSTLVPQMLEPSGKGFRVVVFGMQADAAAYDEAERKLNDNPNKLPWQVCATDGFANLPTGRTDAVTIELRCYPGGLFSRRQPLTMNVACPYRPASSPQGFAIYSPKLLQCDAPTPALPGLLTTFYRGIDSFRMDSPGATFSWNRYLDESI